MCPAGCRHTCRRLGFVEKTQVLTQAEAAPPHVQTNPTFPHCQRGLFQAVWAGGESRVHSGFQGIYGPLALSEPTSIHLLQSCAPQRGRAPSTPPCHPPRRVCGGSCHGCSPGAVSDGEVRVSGH